jgi:hypothetical protein
VDRGTGQEGQGDADERTIAHLVRGLAQLTAPDTQAKDRMRQRILAGLATPAPSPTARVRRTQPRGSRAPRRRPGGADRGPARPDLARSREVGSARGRFAVASVALLALVFSLAGMSLLLARDALPGDALYGIKRTAEAASLGLTFGDESRALKHLEFASARVTEIETLAQRYPNPSDSPTGGYLTALSDFDNDASAGSRQLIALATRNDGRQLESLRAWAKQQSQRLGSVGSRLPGAARNRQGTSLTLLDKIATRSDELLQRMQCYQITTGSSDDVGALPADGACERVPGANAPVSPNTAPRRVPTAGSPGVTTVPAPGLPPAAPPPSGAVPPPITTVPTVPPGGTQPGQPGQTPPTAPPPAGSPPPLVIPLPLPSVELPPLLPGLPGVRIGG